MWSLKCVSYLRGGVIYYSGIGKRFYFIILTIFRALRDMGVFDANPHAVDFD